jgi:hypothetical protein
MYPFETLGTPNQVSQSAVDFLSNFTSDEIAGDFYSEYECGEELGRGLSSVVRKEKCCQIQGFSNHSSNIK